MLNIKKRIIYRKTLGYRFYTFKTSCCVSIKKNVILKGRWILGKTPKLLQTRAEELRQHVRKRNDK